MDIILSKYCGFCFGVKRALKLVKLKARKNNFRDKIFTLGPIIHNSRVIEILNKSNIIPIKEEDALYFKEKAKYFVIRTHGISWQLEKKLRNNKINLIDTTCPFVKKAQNIANNLKNKNIFSIIIGDNNHPEVIGIKSYASDKVLIINSLKELEDIFFEDKFNIKLYKRIGILSQTTQSLEKFYSIINFLKNKHVELEIYNTICLATFERQNEAKDISKEVDIVFVIGGKNSSNTNKLFEICKYFNKNTFYIENSLEEIKINKINNKKIGIITGASTPTLIIREIIEEIRRKCYE